MGGYVHDHDFERYLRGKNFKCGPCNIGLVCLNASPTCWTVKLLHRIVKFKDNSTVLVRAPKLISGLGGTFSWEPTINPASATKGFVDKAKPAKPPSNAPPRFFE